jgi:hypothetical protein
MVNVYALFEDRNNNSREPKSFDFIILPLFCACQIRHEVESPYNVVG